MRAAGEVLVCRALEAEIKLVNLAQCHGKSAQPRNTDSDEIKATSEWPDI